MDVEKIKNIHIHIIFRGTHISLLSLFTYKINMILT